MALHAVEWHEVEEALIHMGHGTKFTEEELERIAAEHTTSSDEDNSAEWDLDNGQNATGSTTITVRMPVALVAALKTRAEAEGVGAHSARSPPHRRRVG